jgi:hypothetical protein
LTKAPPPAPKSVTCTSVEDFFTTACQLSGSGVRFYGAIDVGAGYQSNSTRFAPFSGAGVNYFPGKSSVGGKFLFAPNALSGSNVGVQIKEPLNEGWSFIGQLEAGFNPYSFRLANGVHSIFVERGVPLSQQNAAADSNSQGQPYNNLGAPAKVLNRGCLTDLDRKIINGFPERAQNSSTENPRISRDASLSRGPQRRSRLVRLSAAGLSCQFGLRRVVPSGVSNVDTALPGLLTIA